jgi:hypothetical protein
MKALYDFEPHFCPNCGRSSAFSNQLRLHWNYLLRNSFTCQCGLRYQKASTRIINQAAEQSDGDLQDLISPAWPHEKKAG